MGRFFVNFRGVRALQPADIPCIFNNSQLKPEAKPQVGYVLLPCKPYAFNFSLSPPAAEPYGHDYCIHFCKGVFSSRFSILYVSCLHEMNPCPYIEVGACMSDGFNEAGIGVI